MSGIINNYQSRNWHNLILAINCILFVSIPIISCEKDDNRKGNILDTSSSLIRKPFHSLHKTIGSSISMNDDDDDFVENSYEPPPSQIASDESDEGMFMYNVHGVLIWTFIFS